MTTIKAGDEEFVHGSRLGREHRSVRQHLIEDHGAGPDWANSLSDGGIHGFHDGRHHTTWAYSYDLPHPGDSPFRTYRDGGLALRQQRAEAAEAAKTFTEPEA